MVLLAYARTQYQRAARAEQEAAVAVANLRAALDSTRVVYEDSLRTIEARRAILVSEIEARDAEIETIRRTARAQEQRISSLTRRVVEYERLEAESIAQVTDSADVREAFFSEEVPGGTLSAHVRLSPTWGWAHLTADIDPCRLTDVVASSSTTAELYQITEGRCTVRILEPPVISIPTHASPSIWRDRRTQIVAAIALITGAYLGSHASRR